MPISTQKKQRFEKKKIIKGKALIYGHAVLSCFDLKSFLWFSKIFVWHSLNFEKHGVTWTRVADDPKLLHFYALRVLIE